MPLPVAGGLHRHYPARLTMHRDMPGDAHTRDAADGRRPAGSARVGRLRAVAALVIAALACAAGPAFAADAPAAADRYADLRKKTALVVGVDAYRQAPALANPVSDSQLIRKRLESAGFATRSIADPTLAELDKQVTAFLADAKGADIAVIYYAGHAVQIDGRNYIIPVDFDPAAADILGHLYAIDPLIDRMATAAKARIVILDACRDNPFLDRLRGTLGRDAVGTGLAAVALPTFDGGKLRDATYGLVVAYATQPQLTALDGSGANSPFATALNQALSNPEEDIGQILLRATRLTMQATAGRQQPEQRIALTGKLHLVSRAKPLLCDVLAAETDNNVAVDGVEFDRLDVAAAEPACRADLARLPDNPRLMHNLARVLDKAGRADEALPLYRRAAELGYDWAQNNLGAELLSGRNSPADFKEGVKWLQRASEQGNAQARVNYTEYDMTPLFRARLVALALQKALTEAGIASVPQTGLIDEGTLDAVASYRAREHLPGEGISLQMIVKLGLVDPVFDPQLRRRSRNSPG